MKTRASQVGRGMRTTSVKHVVGREEEFSWEFEPKASALFVQSISKISLLVTLIDNTQWIFYSDTILRPLFRFEVLQHSSEVLRYLCIFVLNSSIVHLMSKTINSFLAKDPFLCEMLIVVFVSNPTRRVSQFLVRATNNLLLETKGTL